MTAATVFILKYRAVMNDLGDMKLVYFLNVYRCNIKKLEYVRKTH